MLVAIIKAVADLPSSVMFLDQRQTIILRFIKTQALTCRTPYDALLTACGFVFVNMKLIYQKLLEISLARY